MKSRHLLIIVFFGVLQSACAPFGHYRTQIPEPKSADFKCAVDAAAQALNSDLDVCEKPESANAHSIQHRFYVSDDEARGDYHLAFVEFDDQGWFADRRQMEALFARLKKLEKEDEENHTNGHTLIYVYAHGWKHNASSCDNNVVCFSRLLERADIAEKATAMFRYTEMKDVKSRKVVGVYLGWRGLPFDSVFNNLTFWSRKDTAARVGRGGVFELLTRLKDYRDSRQEGETADPRKTQLIITGHSFGGLVIYSALSHALMERAAKTRNVEGVTQYDVAKSFGDFVMLVNPAFEGSLYEPLFHIATNRCYDERESWRKRQRPVMMIVTSEADSATGKAFPIGRTLDTLFQHARPQSGQKQSIRMAIGHNPRYRTHDLEWDGTDEDKPTGANGFDGRPENNTADKEPCPCPHLTPTSTWSLEEMVGKSLTSLIGRGLDPKNRNLYGTGVILQPVQNENPPSPRYATSYPYLVVKANEGVIADHNAIYNKRFINFAQLFFFRHIVGSAPLPGDSSQACWPPRTADGPLPTLVPGEKSCQLADGSSCSVPLQQNQL